MIHDPLAALNELERSDAPITPEQYLVARHGSRDAVHLFFARGQAEFFRSMIRNQTIAIRRRRENAGDLVPLYADFGVYWRGYREWSWRERWFKRKSEMRRAG